MSETQVQSANTADSYAYNNGKMNAKKVVEHAALFEGKDIFSSIFCITPARGEFFDNEGGYRYGDSSFSYEENLEAAKGFTENIQGYIDANNKYAATEHIMNGPTTLIGALGFTPKDVNNDGKVDSEDIASMLVDKDMKDGKLDGKVTAEQVFNTSAAKDANNSLFSFLWTWICAE